jgi:hypothetical protein
MSQILATVAVCSLAAAAVFLARAARLAPVLRTGLSIASATGALWLLPTTLSGYGLAKAVLALTALATALVLSASRSNPSSWVARHLRTALLCLALVSGLAYVNFGSFHGQGSFVHFHEAAHYYLGAKYLPELERNDLYVAMLRAESEARTPKLPKVARDLSSYKVVPVAELLSTSEPVRQSFSDERWRMFKKDVALLHRALGDLFANVFTDHGFNASPAWNLIGYTVTNWVPAGSYLGLKILVSIDFVLLGLGFASLAWAFGLNTMLIALIGYTTLFGVGWGWVGGAVLRQIWLSSTLCAMACIHKRRWALAGVLLTLATLMRLFPVAFLIPIGLRAVRSWYVHKRLPGRYLRFFAGVALCGGLGLAVPAALPRGYAHATEFLQTMQLHSRNVSSSGVGLVELAAFRGHETNVTWEEREAIVQHREHVQSWLRLLVVVPLLALTACLVLRTSDLGALTLGAPLIFAGISLSGYYYALLTVLYIAHRSRFGIVALLLLSQAVAQAAGLLDTRPILPFVYQSMIVLALHVTLLWQMLARRRGAPSGGRPTLYAR